MHNGRVTEPKTYGDGVAVVTVTYSPGETLERFLDTLDKATTRDVQAVARVDDRELPAPGPVAAECRALWVEREPQDLDP